MQSALKPVNWNDRDFLVRMLDKHSY